MTRELLITIETDERTRFVQDPEHFRRELQDYAQKLFTVHSQGSVPAVTVTAGDPDLPYSEVQELLLEMLPVLLDGEQAPKALQDGRAYLEKLLARQT